MKSPETPWVRGATDAYASAPSLYWYLWVMLFFYISLVIFVYLGVLINNTSILYTYFQTPGAPGSLTSLRYNFSAIMLLLSVVVNFAFPLCVMFGIVYRYDHGCSVLWVALCIVFFGLQVLVVAGLGDPYSTCNTNGQFGNLCNDLEYCCVFYTDPVNKCPNTVGCTPPKLESELAPNPDFLALFWFNFVFLLVFQLPYLIVVFAYWYAGEPQTLEEKERFDAELERDTTEYTKAVVLKDANAVGHGLKKRANKKV